MTGDGKNVKKTRQEAKFFSTVYDWKFWKDTPRPVQIAIVKLIRDWHRLQRVIFKLQAFEKKGRDIYDPNDVECVALRVQLNALSNRIAGGQYLRWKL